MRSGLLTFVFCLCGVVFAQSGPSYRVEEFALNAGGHPNAGFNPASVSFEISQDAIGIAAFAPLLESNSYAMDLGFARSYPPPLEVLGLAALGDKSTFVWTPERSVGSYRVYRGDLDRLPFDYGTCRVADVPVASAPLNEVPDVGEAFFFLVTAENRLHEEGIAGYDSSGDPRNGPVPCP